MNDVFGKKLGQYILLEPLGEGGMAKVYNAFDSRMERNVAIKVILPSKRSSRTFLEQFEMEAKALASLTHTNIVKVLDYGVENDQPFLVMEYISGGTLKEAVDQKLPWQTAAAILAPIARALEYVHRQQIVHRDVKPSNILLQDDFRPMLSDFGILKLLESKEEKVSSAIGVGVGTPEYMPPEQGMGRDVDFRADIYSLGLVFYELVTGQKPFTADTPMAMVLKHVTDEIPRPTKLNRRIPPFVEQAILRAVQKNPEDRYTSMGEFADVLELIALGEKAPQKKIVKLARRKNTKRKFTPLLLLFLLAVVAGAAAWGYFQFGGMPLPTTATPMASLPIPTISPLMPQVTFTVPAEASPPTPQPTAQAVIATLAPANNADSGVTLLGTPLPVGQRSSFEEIARWGIGGVNVAAWSPQGDAIALGTTSGIFIYDAKSKELQRFIDTKFNVIAMTFNSDGTLIAAGSPNGDVGTWATASGNIAQEISPKPTEHAVTAIAYSPNGRNFAVGHRDGSIRYYAVNQPTAILILQEYPAVEDLAISGDGRFLYASNGGRTISLWDIQLQKKTAELTNPGSVSRLSLSPDRNFLLAGGVTSAAYLWDMVSQRHVSTFPNLNSAAADFGFSYDGKYIVIGLLNGDIKAFQVPAPADYSKIQVPLFTVNAHAAQIRTVALSPTQLIAATGNWEEGLKLWDVLSGENTFSLDQSMRAIQQLHFSKDGEWLATSHEDGVIRLWRVASAQQAYQIEGSLPKGNPFSPNNRFLATIYTPAARREASLRIVDLASGDIVVTLAGYPQNAFVQFTADSKLLVAGTPKTAAIWDVATWEKLASDGGPTAGCGQFFTPQNKLLAVISSAGILFSYDRNIQDMCGTRIEGATLMYYFPKSNLLLFVLGDGTIWLGNKNSPNISRLRARSPYLTPNLIFLGADQESGWYAYVTQTKVRFMTTNTSGWSVDHYDDYFYRVAFLPGKNLIALGTRYGSIHIWSIP
ncbi:MAG: protein kinase domain-containing protein [Chloroflexota bacterium]